jgi:hypothetical protein
MTLGALGVGEAVAQNAPVQRRGAMYRSFRFSGKQPSTLDNK